MRTLSSNFQTALGNLSSDSLPYFILLELDLNEAYYRTSWHHDLIYNGKLYESDNGIVDYQAPKISTSIDRDPYRVALTDHDQVFQTEFRAGVNSSYMRVGLGLLNSSGQPLLSDGDIYLAYAGLIDNISSVADSEDMQAILEGSAPMAALDLVSGIMISRDGMDQIDETDTSFDQIYQGSKEIELRWGKR